MSITSLALVSGATAPLSSDPQEVTLNVHDALISATATANGSMSAEVVIYGAQKINPLAWNKIGSLNFSAANSVAITGSINSGPWKFIKVGVGALSGSGVKLDVDLTFQS